MFDWNDIRYFLAVAEHGSTLAAGRALRVSQTTVARRIAALEEAIRVTLFDRRRAGYVLTSAGQMLVADADRIASAASGFAEAAAARQRLGGGNVRLTTTESMVLNLLPPMLKTLREEHPEILIELDSSEQVRDLENGAADVAIRVSRRLSGAGLVGRRLGQDNWTVYCSRNYAAANGKPRSRRELASHPLISVAEAGETGRYYNLWLRENGLEGSIAMQHANVTGLLSAVRSGLGVAALPCLIAEADPELVRCFPAAPQGARDLWLLTHERLRHEPRVRIVMDFLALHLRRHASMVQKRLVTIEPRMTVSRDQAGARSSTNDPR